MTKRQHITPDGKIMPCSAKDSSSCPYGNQPHFNNLEEAQEYISKQGEQKFGLLPGTQSPELSTAIENFAEQIEENSWSQDEYMMPPFDRYRPDIDARKYFDKLVKYHKGELTSPPRKPSVFEYSDKIDRSEFLMLKGNWNPYDGGGFDEVWTGESDYLLKQAEEEAELAGEFLVHKINFADEIVEKAQEKDWIAKGANSQKEGIVAVLEEILEYYPEIWNN